MASQLFYICKKIIENQIILREKRRVTFTDRDAMRHFSIHTPTRSATCLAFTATHDVIVSIHAPTRGATLATLWDRPVWASFNPRTYERCDHWIKSNAITIDLFQSTHLREVRLLIQNSTRTSLTGFNPRTYERCDAQCHRGQCVLILFQSTHLREVRHPWHVPPHPPWRFNPRTCERCDMRKDCVVPQGKFQSTHLREVRQYYP